MNYILSIDSGSSSTKVCLFDTAGNLVALERVRTEMRSTDRGGSAREYDVDSWWKAAVQGISTVLGTSSIKGGSIIAVGLTGQIGTHIFLDRSTGEPLLPAISWQDSRAAAEAFRLREEYPDLVLDTLLGLHLPPGTAWPIPRLLWLKSHHPEILGKNYILLQTKDYIGYRMTGRLKTDVLSLRGLVDPGSGSVHPRLAEEILGIPDIMQHLPEVAEPTGSLGMITYEASVLLGIPEGTPVITGTGDFHASLMGTGIIDGSSGFNITGTSDHIGRMVPSDELIPRDPRLGLYPGIMPGWNIWYGATSSGGGAVQWFLDTIAHRSAGESIASYVQRMLEPSSRFSRLIFLPYLNGERAPVWDAQARGTFLGISLAHGEPHFLRAVLEGVAFSLYDCLSIIHEDSSTRLPIRISGAASGDRVWNQMKSDVFGVPVTRMECCESTGLGAAVLASVGVGLYNSCIDGVSNMVRTAEEYLPDRDLHSEYEQVFRIYRETYQALKPVFFDLAQKGSSI